VVAVFGDVSLGEYDDGVGVVDGAEPMGDRQGSVLYFLAQVTGKNQVGAPPRWSVTPLFSASWMGLARDATCGPHD
jgi:hypothetical protein